jgi:hypothetical protein
MGAVSICAAVSILVVLALPKRQAAAAPAANAAAGKLAS